MQDNNKKMKISQNKSINAIYWKTKLKWFHRNCLLFKHLLEIARRSSMSIKYRQNWSNIALFQGYEFVNGELQLYSFLFCLQTLRLPPVRWMVWTWRRFENSPKRLKFAGCLWVWLKLRWARLSVQLKALPTASLPSAGMEV